MAAGQILTQADYCSQVATLAIRLYTILGFNVPQVQDEMTRLGIDGILALPTPPGFTPLTNQDAMDLMNAMNELNELAGCYTGAKIVTAGETPGTGASQAGNGHDFRLYPAILWGFGYQYP